MSPEQALPEIDLDEDEVLVLISLAWERDDLDRALELSAVLESAR